MEAINRLTVHSHAIMKPFAEKFWIQECLLIWSPSMANFGFNNAFWATNLTFQHMYDYWLSQKITWEILWIAIHVYCILLLCVVGGDLDVRFSRNQWLLILAVDRSFVRLDRFWSVRPILHITVAAGIVLVFWFIKLYNHCRL